MQYSSQWTWFLLNSSHKQVLFIHVAASFFTVDEILCDEILLILDNLISVGNISGVMSFVKNTYALFLNRYNLSLLEGF